MGSVTQHQQLQQHVAVSRKRSNEQGDSGCSEKRKKPNENPETTKADLEDGANVSIEVEQVTVLSKQCISTGIQDDLPRCIQSLLRRGRQVRLGEPYGNLLKATAERTSETIDVEFTGTSTEDPATAFHQKKCDDKKACAIRHRDGDDYYYLKVKKSGGVNLQKLVHFPTDDKYFFVIKRIDAIAFAIQSLKQKGWFLHCSELGKVSMVNETTGGNGAPRDLKTWFTFIDSWVQSQKVSMTYVRNDSGIESDFSEETTLDDKDSGKDDPCNAVEENSEEAQNKDAENPEVGNSEAPGEDNCNNPESGKSPKDQEEEHSGEL